VKSVSQQVPIIVYHSIANPHRHALHRLSVPIALFERQMAYLRRNDFRAVDLREIQAHLEHGHPLPPKAVGITFDDGYLDNWVHAYPILKRYGMKATLFVTTDFIDPRDICRPTLEDVREARHAPAELPYWGHVSWTELKRMQDSGVVDVQSHTLTHNWYFSDARVEDFHHPRGEHYWLAWHSHPEQKYDWLNMDFRAQIPLGRPVYRHQQTLLGPRYFEDPAIAEACVRHVADNGGPDFFRHPGWRAALHGVVAARRRAHGDAGYLESPAQYRARVEDELRGSKRIIEERLGKPVELLCWPCGDYSPELQRMALDCGYRATVNVAKVTNRYGDDPTELRRLVFEQDYTGVLRMPLVYANFVGMINYRSGRRMAYPLAPITRRLMLLGRALERLGE
jgi:peptidoglycan/xylan/chitin deacetylase (PgdA/CDA1 family)